MMIKTQKLKYLLIGAVLGGGMATLIFYPQIQICNSILPNNEQIIQGKGAKKQKVMNHVTIVYKHQEISMN